MSNNLELLQALRKDIDKVDGQIINLLKERMTIVHNVGKIKAQTKQKSFIRPAREATMVKSIISHLHPIYPESSIERIWRSIISASLNLEQPLTIAVYEQNNNRDFYWLAREYFGNFMPIVLFNTPEEVIKFTTERACHVGIIGVNDLANNSLISYKDKVKIFGHIPLVINSNSSHQISAFAIAQTDVEETTDDITIIACKIKSNITQSAIISQFGKNGLSIAKTTQSYDYMILYVDSFISSLNTGAMANVMGQIANYIEDIALLGCYAKPIEV